MNIPRDAIAYVEVDDGPDEGTMTLDEFLAWRAAETERMLLSIRDQIVAHFEREEGVIEH